MHVFTGKTVSIVHYGDFRGPAVLRRVPDGAEFPVAAEDLLAFAAEYVRMKRIGKIEQATTDELLLGGK